MLILVATPIGNLADITLRAIDTLRGCDLVLCEDTRHSKHLLTHYQIDKPLLSYHKFNEKEQLGKILDFLKNGKTIALISDAGTPLIADPGALLVQACIQEGIEVQAIPGPCALILALILSGMEYDRFQFIGFLQKKENDLRKELQGLIHYPGVSLCYESPHRIQATLELLKEMAPASICQVARELTKKFETILRGMPETLLAAFAKNPPKGECVLLIQGKKEEADYSTLSVEEHVKEVESTFNVSKRDAIKIVADLRRLSKRDLYRSFHSSDPF